MRWFTKENLIKAINELDRHITVHEIEEMLKMPKSTIERHIRLRVVKKLDIWIPHELKEIHLTKRIKTCNLNLKRNEFDLFLKRIITGDEKWIVYNNFVGKRLWSKRDEPTQTLKSGTRLYFSEGFWCAESESNFRIAPSRQVFEKS